MLEVFLFFFINYNILEARRKHQIPSDIAQNNDLLEAIKDLPSNYNFEVAKTIWHIKQNNCKRGFLIFFNFIF